MICISIIDVIINLNDAQRSVIGGFIKTVADSLVKGDVESTGSETDVVDDAINRMELYRAARSTTNAEHEIISDDRGTVQKLKNLPKVTDDDDL